MTHSRLRPAFFRRYFVRYCQAGSEAAPNPPWANGQGLRPFHHWRPAATGWWSLPYACSRCTSVQAFHAMPSPTDGQNWVGHCKDFFIVHTYQTHAPCCAYLGCAAADALGGGRVSGQQELSDMALALLPTSQKPMNGYKENSIKNSHLEDFLHRHVTHFQSRNPVTKAFCSYFCNTVTRR